MSKKMKLASLGLAVAMVLAACGDAKTEVTQEAAAVTAVSESAEVTVDEAEVVLETAEESEAQESAAEEIVCETAAEEPQVSFDNSWASNNFEKLIPQPPFTGWSGEMTSCTVYEMLTAQANADGSGNYYKEFEAYAQSLKECGYEVSGEFNEFTARDAAGNVIELLCGDGHAWITITTK